MDSGGKLVAWPNDKRDDFDFHIVNFQFFSSSIPSGLTDGIYISQLIRYARCCSRYDDFKHRLSRLVDRLLSQGYKVLQLEKSFKVELVCLIIENKKTLRKRDNILLVSTKC